ncbi:hypothetical protein SAMN00017477_0551 [Peptoniphilus asaccharolyticus DSM 20463]|uniref:Uncharacterized protein n=1 Tax=Peptoniphilus asaccharolyticus DSM 20463 TaxID=573058 RepID=A0A1W1UR76_PEPAS|nr:DUF6648 family protein [Peptoniphilus asaccharolyticus]MBL7575029.1 hypothetical protein [Peptoniphilus asaccharolyticus]SMB83311.1 hypothetical protein SAMN00017477_0551 [Peptoniphilus asaccharolyticus DSM 20463]
MTPLRKKNKFEDFFERRSFLIMQYSNGDISKKEFLQYNYEYFAGENARPFIKIDSYEKGMYNYQYYNGMAKYYRMLAREVKNTKKHSRYYNYYLNLGNKYYHEKDETAFKILKLQNFENVSSYYIKCESKSLKHILYEIVLEDKKEAIFHSKAIWLLDILKNEKVFEEVEKSSLIEEYINEKY